MTNTDFKVSINDTTEEDDDNISGTAHFKIPLRNGKMFPEEIAQCVHKVLIKLKDEYKDILSNFDVDISLIGANFEDGWIDFSIEGKEYDKACVYWKVDHNINLASTPESRVGVHW